MGGLSAMENVALNRANDARQSAAQSAQQLASARRALLSWKEYAQQLNDALKDNQIDAARQAVIKEELLRELFILDPAHRLHVKANRQEVAHAGIKDMLTRMEIPELAGEKERIDKILAT